jgi:hypothetical protein
VAVEKGQARLTRPPETLSEREIIDVAPLWKRFVAAEFENAKST